jgi:hypothetical protein
LLGLAVGQGELLLEREDLGKRQSCQSLAERSADFRAGRPLSADV